MPIFHQCGFHGKKTRAAELKLCRQRAHSTYIRKHLNGLSSANMSHETELLITDLLRKGTLKEVRV